MPRNTPLPWPPLQMLTATGMCGQLVPPAAGQGTSFSAAQEHLMLKRKRLSKWLTSQAPQQNHLVCLCSSWLCWTSTSQCQIWYFVCLSLCLSGTCPSGWEGKGRSSSAHGLLQSMRTEKDPKIAPRDGLRQRQRGQPAAAEPPRKQTACVSVTLSESFPSCNSTYPFVIPLRIGN